MSMTNLKSTNATWDKTDPREVRRACRELGYTGYTAGLAPNVEVTDAEAALTQARTNEVNAAYDYLSALANLNRSLGRYAGDTLAMLNGAPPVTAPAPPK